MKRLLFPAVLLTSGTLAWLALPAPSTQPAERAPPAQAEPIPRAVRQLAITRAHGEPADPAQIDQLLDQTDRFHDAFPDPAAQREEIQRLLDDATPDEASLRAYFAQHPDLFAYRTFEQSRPAIERIIQVRMARAALLDVKLDDLGPIPVP